MPGFLIGIAVIGALVYWLYQKSRQAEAECFRLVGLAAVSNGPRTRGQSAEGFDYFEQVIAEGTLHGVAAQLSVRNVRSGGLARAKRDRGSLTVLSLTLSRPPPAPLRLQPAGIMRAAEMVAGGEPEMVFTGDAEFDRAWHLYSSRGEAAVPGVDASLRQALMELRRELLPAAASGVGGALAAGLLLGTFELKDSVARYYVIGTPSAQTGERLKRAAPILARLGRVPPRE